MVEVAEIFRQHGPQYRDKFGNKMLPSHRQVMRAIERCRTSALGGHVYHCPECDETQYHYRSCRNRHCPKCQNDKAYQWLEKQQAMLLPTPYFLVTFTLPSGLRQLARSHQQLVYHLLFRTSAAAMQHLARDPRFVGGQMGMVGVLHTWGRNLSYHPHVHYLIPAGGVAPDGQTWLPANKNFLFPVRALSRIFRAKFRDALRESAYYADVPAAVWKQEWVVHCQPVGNGLAALKYLAPYIFRVAISNKRILKLANGKVTFRYHTSDTGKLCEASPKQSKGDKTCTLVAEEFIRRFLQHVLPRGFVKVRYYGFFSSGLRQRLATLRQQLTGPAVDQPAFPEGAETETEIADILTSVPLPNHAVLCPLCGRIMQRRLINRPTGRCPP